MANLDKNSSPEIEGQKIPQSAVLSVFLKYHRIRSLSSGNPGDVDMWCDSRRNCLSVSLKLFAYIHYPHFPTDLLVALPL